MSDQMAAPTAEMNAWLIDTFPTLKSSFDGETTGGDAPDLLPKSTVSAAPQPGGPGPARRRTPSADDIANMASEKNIQKFFSKAAAMGFPVSDEDRELPTPFNKLIKELQSGMGKAKELLGYMHTASSYMKDYGQKLKGVDQAAKQLDAIGNQLKGRMSTLGGAVDRFQQLTQWATAGGQFAAATVLMHPEDPDSVQAWSDAMQKLADKTAPFANWLQDENTAALLAAGEEVDASAGMAAGAAQAAAAATAVLAIAGALIVVGIAGLKAGIAVVNAYLARYNAIWKQIAAQEGHAPAPPDEPAAWQSEDERLDKRQSDIIRSLNERRANADWAEDIKKSDAIRLKTQEFDDHVFVKKYQENRQTIVKQILAAYERRASPTPDVGRVAEPIELVWRNVLKYTGEGYSAKVKSKVSDTEANDEIGDLGHNDCPFIKVFHAHELKSYLDAPPAKAATHGKAQ